MKLKEKTNTQRFRCCNEPLNKGFVMEKIGDVILEPFIKSLTEKEVLCLVELLKKNVHIAQINVITESDIKIMADMYQRDTLDNPR